MPRQRIAPGTVGPVAVVPLGTESGTDTETVIPFPTADDGSALPFPKGIKVGETVKVERDWAISEFVLTRWRGLARVVDTDGTEHMIRRWRSTKGAAEAATRQAGLDKLAALEAVRQAAVTTATAVADGDVTTTISDLVRQAMTLPDVAKLATRTKQNYGYSARLIHEHAIGVARPRDVDVAAIRTFLTAVATAHGSGVAKQCKAILRKALDLAVESRALQVPANLVLATRDAIPDVRVQDRGLDHKRVLTDEQVDAFLAALQGDPLAAPMIGQRSKSKHGETRTAAANGLDVGDLLTLTFRTGLRIGEATALRWSDLDLASNTPTADVTGTVTYVNGVGAGRQDSTKSRAGDRAVPLRADVVAMLLRRAALFGADLSSALPVFGSPQAHERFRDPSNLAKVVRAAFARHGYGWASSHLARRYRVTSLLDRGVPVGKVADLVGHAQIQQTMAYVGRGRGTDAQVRAAL